MIRAVLCLYASLASSNACGRIALDGFLVATMVGQCCRRVCVVGAGPSGLVAARELRKEGHSVVVMEQNHEVGGQWLYDARVDGENPMGRTPLHSSIYASLRLLSPREVMGYSDFPFVVRKGRDDRRFPGHREFFLYLKDFCDWFRLRELVRFNTRVDYVGMAPSAGAAEHGGAVRWVVRSTEKKTGNAVEETYDAVVVATGHYSQPLLPKISGMDVWKRRQMHSHVYRVPDPFRNEVVVVVGNSYSGQDISIELVKVAREVHLSSKSLDISEGLSKVIKGRPNLHIHLQIEQLHEDGRVVFEGGDSVVADSIIYCTGYSYWLPFLDTKGIVTVDDNRMGPLFEHTFPPALAPSLSFVGIPRKIIGLPFFESQAKWIAQVLSGRRSLPPPEEMMRSVEEFYRSLEAAGVPQRYTHDIANFEYCDRYADYCDYPHLEEWRKQLCLSTIFKSYTDLEGYRDQSDDVEELLQEAYQSAHFTQSGLDANFTP